MDVAALKQAKSENAFTKLESKVDFNERRLKLDKILYNAKYSKFAAEYKEILRPDVGGVKDADKESGNKKRKETNDDDPKTQNVAKSEKSERAKDATKEEEKKETTIEDYSDKEKLYKTRPIQIKSPDDITNEERVKFYKSFIKLSERNLKKFYKLLDKELKSTPSKMEEKVVYLSHKTWENRFTYC